ncbi:alpha/beta hydrolase [Anaerosporobacter sp.]|uniref:alpha/beta hydrolase n=1 Tax=Anaerosporobacter sp. TaxID=1872529 RepID=UPI00286F2842|nr:alpha/beta hydrolase [Anaerosporobacter sp.]
MTNKYPIHPDFEAIGKILEPVLAGDQVVTQAMIEQFFTEWNNNTSDEEIKVTKMSIPSYDDVQIDLQIMEPQTISDQPAPCLVYYHGGGFILPINPFQLALLREYILGTGCKVVCVDYRLAPAVAFPVPVEDCYQTLLWTYQNATSLGIDKQKIVLAGDSAGGSFAAAVSLMARDKNGPKTAGQMLIYPTTDARLETESMKTFIDTPVWNAPATDMVYKLYMRDGDQGLRAYSSPLEADSFADLPQAYVEVTEFDCLRDEGILYAEALQKAGVATILNKTKGTVHAYDYALENELTKEGLSHRIQFLKQIFGCSDR